MSSSLESLIVGEDQILGQIKDAKNKANNVVVLYFFHLMRQGDNCRKDNKKLLYYCVFTLFFDVFPKNGSFLGVSVFRLRFSCQSPELPETPKFCCLLNCSSV